MKLPRLPFTGDILKTYQTKFGGLDHRLGATDGALYDMRNLTSDNAPLLSSRAPRSLYRTLPNPGGLYAWDALCWVDGTGVFYDGIQRGTVTAGEKTFASLGAYIVILPDKAYYNAKTGVFGKLESEWAGTSLTFTNGVLFEETAEANTLQASGANWAAYFKVGDAVTIAGCTTHPENNKTPIIRAIDGDRLYFYEYAFKLDGDGTTPYTETGALTVKRTVPDLLFLCENENRLWGTDGTEIFASKLGDIFNWNVFDGLETDSYAVGVGSPGKFTACASFMGYPVFFKEDKIYEVYGAMPSRFEVVDSATLGVAEGSHKSLAVAGEILFYLSKAGIMAYAGGVPRSLGEPFGTEHFADAAAGSDGLKYYVSMRGEVGHRLYVYDTMKGMWHVEDETQATHFAAWDGGLYFLTAAGEIWTPGGTPTEGPVDWWVEFSDFVDSSPSKKGVGKLQIRVELDHGASVKAMIRFDTETEWIEAGVQIEANVKRSYILPIVPRRDDHYRVRLEGTGGCRVYSLTREHYVGSEFKSTPGRQ
jgi:hypothetical protein